MNYTKIVIKQLQVKNEIINLKTAETFIKTIINNKGLIKQYYFDILELLFKLLIDETTSKIYLIKILESMEYSLEQINISSDNDHNSNFDNKRKQINQNIFQVILSIIFKTDKICYELIQDSFSLLSLYFNQDAQHYSTCLIQFLPSLIEFYKKLSSDFIYRKKNKILFNEFKVVNSLCKFIEFLSVFFENSNRQQEFIQTLDITMILLDATKDFQFRSFIWSFLISGFKNFKSCFVNYMKSIKINFYSDFKYDEMSQDSQSLNILLLNNVSYFFCLIYETNPLLVKDCSEFIVTKIASIFNSGQKLNKLVAFNLSCLAVLSSNTNVNIFRKEMNRLIKPISTILIIYYNKK